MTLGARQEYFCGSTLAQAAAEKKNQPGKRTQSSEQLERMRVSCFQAVKEGHLAEQFHG